MKKRSIALASVLGLSSLWAGTEWGQKRVNEEHARMDYAFRVDELRGQTREKTGQIIEIDDEDIYVKAPSTYQPTLGKVWRDSFFSNQWPWLAKEEFYDAQGREKTLKESVKLLYKATKNTALTVWRSTIDHTDPRFADAQNNRKKLLIVDKSVRRLFIYDLETLELERHTEIGIGKGTPKIPGGEGPRRIIGDYQTPNGYYMVVQKRDDTWWREHKGVPFPEWYGGHDGGMIVLAGPWHPEIAFHAAEEDDFGDGKVSNGCVHITHADAQHFLEELPLGSYTIITN